jgi:hypothetical protein
MKSRELAAILRAVSRLLATADHGSAVGRISALAAVFDAAPTLAVVSLVKRLRDQTVTQGSGGLALGELAPVLAALEEIFALGAKASVISDFSLLSDLMRDHPEAELGSMRESLSAPAAGGIGRRKPQTAAAPALRDDLVLMYQQKLEASLGDHPGFMAVHAALSKDKSIKLPEARALAKALTGLTAKSKADAFRTILDRHQSLMAVRAKGLATGGRSAA